jgi:hypothetical protein
VIELADVLFQFSEWIDEQGLMKSEKESGDDRTHDELVQAFFEQYSYDAKQHIEKVE